MRILVAEDDPDTREFLCLMLSKAGYDVDSRPDGAQAWEALKAEHYALLVADCMMPHMDGFELCRMVRASQKPYTYVIMLTAFGGRENFLKGMDSGADDFLTKPCDLEELRARLAVARRILGLQEEVRRLTGLLPICTYCKKIRQSDAEWVPIETYVARRSEASFSHGICPDCFTDHVRPELERVKKRP
jgi:sigma-B regulation protein RsbU (phosphoserine phosphatase)